MILSGIFLVKSRTGLFTCIPAMPARPEPSAPARRLELLAPARSVEIGRQAILHGADAVYIGGPTFGARSNASNPVSDIASLVEFAHRFHVRIYVALNTILHDAELEPAQKLVQELYDVGVDALIIQDMGLLELDLPPIDLHASTQCDIRTPEKARFLAEAGFSQLVLARELTLEQIAVIRAAVPGDIELEYFVHGALCVAYSGQCYISHAQTGRSANRGDCSQACRLSYTLEDAQGRIVAFDKHLLSVKDNNQSNNLAALVKAGISSFKIEGRYKDAGYVKNVTGHYRQLIDALMAEADHSGPQTHAYKAASSGVTRLLFTPDPERSFHRGSTDYFTHGRQTDIGAFDTPAHIGQTIGIVSRVGADWFDLETSQPLANGDGLAWLHKRESFGLQANTVEQRDGGQWRVYPNEPMHRLPGLKPGTVISRNRDHVWEQALNRASAERYIRINARLSEQADGFCLQLTDEDGLTGKAVLSCEKQLARDPEQAETALRKQIDRFGTSDFRLVQLDIDWQKPWFIPASAVNGLRREALAALAAARQTSHPFRRRRQASATSLEYPEDSLSYLANVYNHAARRFYEKHGVKLIASAFESHEETGEVSLMITRHCLRYSFSLCPKQAKGVTGVQGQVRAEPMTLVNGDDRLTLQFDCKACEMHVMGKIRPNILRSAPPSVVPLTFHPAGPPTRHCDA